LFVGQEQKIVAQDWLNVLDAHNQIAEQSTFTYHDHKRYFPLNSWHRIRISNASVEHVQMIGR
jgi:hypothetical protein